MPIALVTSTKGRGNGSYSMDAAVDTTGASLLVWVHNDITATPSFTDSKGNTWTLAAETGAGGQFVHIFYAWGAGLVVGSGHDGTVAGSPIGCSVFYAFSGVQTGSDPLLTTNSNIAFGSATIQPGAVNPSPNDGALILTGIEYDVKSALATIDSGFGTVRGDTGSGGVYVGGSSSFLVQTTAASVNPTWTPDSSGNLYAAIAAFKAAATAAPKPAVRRRRQPFQQGLITHPRRFG